nr:leucokinin 2 [Aedes aegypti=mosquitoes, Peptide, 7 aa] [Aedes aegypti]
NPFHAWG